MKGNKYQTQKTLLWKNVNCENDVRFFFFFFKNKHKYMYRSFTVVEFSISFAAFYTLESAHRNTKIDMKIGNIYGSIFG